MVHSLRAGAATRCLALLCGIAPALIIGGDAGESAHVPSVPVSFASQTKVATIRELGERGAYVVGYEHAQETWLSFPLSNPGSVPMVVTDVRLDAEPMSLFVVLGAADGHHSLPVTVRPGHSTTIVLRGRFDNCRYYQERELERLSAVFLVVTWPSKGSSIGIRTLRLDREIIIRSPMIVGCPDRTLTREDDLRPSASRRLLS